MLGLYSSVPSLLPGKEESTMPETGLNGPFALTEAVINQEVTKTSPGAYALDQSHESGGFHITYVGRSDKDVNARLREHLGKYKRFKFEYYETPKDAFEKECGLYHDFNPPAKITHPERPMQSGWKCPRCKQFG
jgi:hypothetical protein